MNFIFLEPHTLTFYSEKKGGIPLTIPEDALRDLEVINIEIFKKCIDSFVSTYKFDASTIAMILSNKVTFEKEIPTVQENEVKQALSQFATLVPFEQIVIRSFKLPKSSFIIASNKELTDTIIQQFHAHSIVIHTVTPLVMLAGGVSYTGVTQELVRTINKYADKLKMYNFLDDKKNEFPPLQSKPSTTIPVTPPPSSSQISRSHSSHKRIFLLIIFFIVLIGVLVFLIMRNNPFTQNQQNKKTSPTPSKARTPSLTPSKVQKSSPSALLDKSTIVFEIVYDTSSNVIKEEVELVLTDNGVSTVSATLRASSVVSSDTIVIFSLDIPQEVREEIAGLLQTILPQMVIQEDQDAKAKVLISLPNQ